MDGAGCHGVVVPEVEERRGQVRLGLGPQLGGQALVGEALGPQAHVEGLEGPTRNNSVTDLL